MSFFMIFFFLISWAFVRTLQLLGCWIHSNTVEYSSSQVDFSGKLIQYLGYQERWRQALIPLVITSSVQRRRRSICSLPPTASSTAKKVVSDTSLFLALSNCTCKAAVGDGTDRKVCINTVHSGVVQWLTVLQMHYALVHIRCALTMSYAHVQFLQLKVFSRHASKRSTEDIISFSFFSDCPHTYKHHRGLRIYTQEFPAEQHLRLHRDWLKLC